MRSRLPLLVVLLLCLVHAGCAADRSAVPAAPTGGRQTPSLRETVAYLASDEMEGRGPDTAGIDKAADYIAQRFADAGLRPPPSRDGYLLPFEYVTAEAVDPSTRLTVGDTQYRLGDDFTAAAFSAERAFDGPVVFVGYGVTAPKRDYDDYAGVDVKGKVVLMLRYEPHTDAGKSRFTDGAWSDQATFMAKVRAARERGAAAVLLVNPPVHHASDDLIPFAREFAGMEGSMPFLHVRRPVADDLLRRGGLPDLQALQRQIDSTGKPASQALADVRASGEVKLRRKVRQMKNVAGVLPGRKADEYVVVGAHYDHVGRGAFGSMAPGSNQIHNGADDNASGTAAMIAVAERFAKASQPPERSILFVAFTAEEMGLIGSARFVDEPPVPLDRMVAMLNLDMVGRARNNALYIGGGGTAEPLDDILKRADEASPLEVKSMGRGGFGPSDHTSFAAKRIPVLFFFTGVHGDYHRPTDDADKVNYDGLQQVVDFATETVQGVTTMPRSPYLAGGDEQAMGRTVGRSRVTLGVIPDYGTDASTTGVRITGTTAGSPADRAGLRDGDVLTAIGDRRLENLYDLMAVLADVEPGQTLPVTYTRDGKETKVDVTFTERK